jgi:hypothetical protein
MDNKHNSTYLFKKNKCENRVSNLLIGADKETISDDIGTRSIFQFSELDAVKAITLTRRESDLIALANPGHQPPKVFEEIYPWVPRQKFLNNSRANLLKLKWLKKKYAPHIITAGEYCDQKWGTVCNSIGQKTYLDSRFYSAWHAPIQDVYVLEEKRPNRKVIAIDYNSMFANCMLFDFPKPSKMQKVRFNRKMNEAEVLTVGLYRCILYPPVSNFIKKHNPFRIFFSGRYLGANLKQPLTIDLNEFELDFFYRHFAKIYLIDAVVSKKCIKHPLASEVRRAYQRRLNFKKQGNKSLADREKYFLTLMASATHRPRKKVYRTTSIASMRKKLRKNFGVEIEGDLIEPIEASWLDGRKGLRTKYTGGFVETYAPNLHDGSACFQFNQRIVARSRIILLETMENLINTHTDLEICYANIDSIHFSIPEVNSPQVLEDLESNVSDDLGGIKIEAVSKHGLWLETGRYWIYSDKIDQFKNKGIGVKQGPFCDQKTMVAISKFDDLFVPYLTKVTLHNSTSILYHVENAECSNFIRQKLITINSHDELKTIFEKIENNLTRSVPIKMQTFALLKSNFT